MDLGTILTIVLGAAPVAALARGLGDWIRKQVPQSGSSAARKRSSFRADCLPIKFELVKLALEKSK
jgi:hypothetical protein